MHIGLSLVNDYFIAHALGILKRRYADIYRDDGLFVTAVASIALYYAVITSFSHAARACFLRATPCRDDGRCSFLMRAFIYFADSYGAISL